MRRSRSWTLRPSLWLMVAVAASVGLAPGVMAAGPTITEFSVGITAGSRPFGITAGPDGNLWFTEDSPSKIGRITSTGTITEFSAGLTPNSFPRGITTGPDGNLWFTESSSGDKKIGRINLAIALVSTGTGPGGGPHVKLFSVNSASGTPTQLGGGFFAYDPGFTGGVQATLVQAGGELFLVTGVGSGGGPHIWLFRVTDLAAGTIVQVGPGFMAYDIGFTGGARVAATTDGAGHLLIVTGVG